MKSIVSERNIVVVLFVLVLITFAMAQEDSRKMEKAYIGINSSAASALLSMPSQIATSPVPDPHSVTVPGE